MPSKTVLITGSAGFIGFHLSQKLLDQNFTVVGFDNLNNYYEVSLKESRLALLKNHTHFTFVKGDLQDRPLIKKNFHRF